MTPLPVAKLSQNAPTVGPLADQCKQPVVSVVVVLRASDSPYTRLWVAEIGMGCGHIKTIPNGAPLPQVGELTHCLACHCAGVR